MKKCPNPSCNNTEFHSDELLCCPYCRADLEPAGHSSAQIGNDNLFMGSVNKENQTNARVESGDDVSHAKIGNDNTFTGGVHTTDNRTKVGSDNEVHTNSHNTTNNTTIYQAPKSNSEKLEEARLSYRLECKKLFVNGLISKEGEDLLRALQARLSLEDELVASIKEEIRQQSRKRISPTASVLSGIHQTKTIIEQNSDAALRRQLDRLASWMLEYDDDTLKSMYFQLSAILEPERFANRYEKSAKEEYWEVYWAHIAYLLRRDETQANIAHASLGRLQDAYGYPEQNDVILHLAGRLMQNDPMVDIQNERNSLTANYSQELQLLLAAIDELLQMDWEKESVTIRPAHSFYIRMLFEKFVETQKKAGVERRRKKEEISRAERARQEELKRQKDYLLRKYQEVEDIIQACEVLNIPYQTFRTWLDEDMAFNSSYYEITRHIDEITARKAKIEAETKRQKSEFKNRYEQNNCDLLKTCFESGVDSDTVGEWRKLDKAFDNALATIERDNERWQQQTFAMRYASNKCNLQKTCADMGIGIDAVDNWRRYNKAFDNELSFLKKEYERSLQEAFARSYESLGCDMRKACDELGIKMDTVNDWRRSNQVFDDELNALKKEHARIMQDAFVVCYKSNNCNLRKSCSDMQVSPEEVRVWRSSYKQFDADLTHLERARAIQRFKRALPYILIVCLLIAVVIAIWIKDQAAEKALQEQDVTAEEYLDNTK